MMKPMGAARILGRTGPAAGITHALTGSVTLGRSSGNDIVINSPYLSGHHARVYEDGGEHWIEDLGSRNGTRVDGVALTGPVCLEQVHVITLADAVDLVYVRAAGSRAQRPAGEDQGQAGRTPPEHAPGASAVASAPPGQVPESGATVPGATRFGLEFDPLVDPRVESHDVAGTAPPAEPADPVDTPSDRKSDPAEPPPDAEVAESAAPPAAGAPQDRTIVLQPGGDAFIDPRAGHATEPTVPDPPRYELVLATADGSSRVFPLKPGTNVLGRADDCDVTLPDPDRWLSRHHAVLEVLPDGILTLADRGTVNGTFVNDERIETARIEPGSEFRLGPYYSLTLRQP
jgi:pSer/pThr/pTyr-binding forkhead associated (FHA) protein